MATGYDKGMNGHRAALAASMDVEIEEPKPCCERIGHGSWCLRPLGHDGDHEGPPPQYGPVCESSELWRRQPPLLSDVLKTIARERKESK